MLLHSAAAGHHRRHRCRTPYITPPPAPAGGTTRLCLYQEIVSAARRPEHHGPGAPAQAWRPDRHSPWAPDGRGGCSGSRAAQSAAAGRSLGSCSAQGVQRRETAWESTVAPGEPSGGSREHSV